MEKFVIFDDVRSLQKKKKITKLDKARFLAQVPDTTISVHIKPGDVDAIKKAYSDEDINELFDYWFGIYAGMADKRGYLWE